MKIVIAFVLASMVSPLLVFSPGGQQGRTTEEIIKELERELAAALVKGDPATVDRILGDDYLEITAQGVLLNKADVMAVVRAKASVPGGVSVGPEVSVEETRTLIEAHVAVLVGLITTRYQHMEYQVTPGSGQLPSPASIERARFMKVFAKRKGRWQLIASQTTGVAKT